MKLPSSVSIALKKTSAYPEKKDASEVLKSSIPSSIDTILDNMSLISLNDQKGLLQQQRMGSKNDTNNNITKNFTAKNDSCNSVSTIANVTDVNSNKNKHKSRKMKVNHNDKDNTDAESFVLRRRQHRIDSGFYSSGSDEDASDRNCKSHCDNMHGRFRPRRQEVHLLHGLSLSRSHSLSSLDSAVGDIDRPSTDTYFPSASSWSSLSSMWSLASSGNNLSLSPSLDSQMWTSVVISNGESAVSGAELDQCVSIPVISSLALSTKLSTPNMDNSNVIMQRTNRGSGFSTVNPEDTLTIKQESTCEREEEDIACRTSVIPLSEIRNVPTAVTSTPVQPLLVRSRHVRRRPRSRDHNNNTGSHHGAGLHEYLPNAPCRLGDCFSKKGVLSLVALIIYTLSLMVVFTLLSAMGAGVKAGL